MATYNNLDSLYKALGKQIEKSLDKTADQIQQLAKDFIMSEFYEAYPDPKVYERTYQLLSGCVRSAVKHSGNTYTVEIYMDESTATQGYKDDDVMDVWLLASVGFHGNLGIQRDGKFWQSTVKEVKEKWRSYLIKNGLNVV